MIQPLGQPSFGELQYSLSRRFDQLKYVRTRGISHFRTKRCGSNHMDAPWQHS
jgi:hypothetical protein